MLGLWTSEKGYQAPTEGGREGGRDGHQMPLAVDFPQVQLTYLCLFVRTTTIYIIHEILCFSRLTLYST